MHISAIVAMDAKRGMGKNNSIPWHIPGEQKRFKDITTPHPIIMGRKTFESIGRVLPGRANIIISRDPHYKVDGALVVGSLDEALATSYKLPATEDEVFIIGGGQIFQEAMPYLTRLYLTIIQHDFACDTFFPEYADFTKVISKEKKTDWEYPYTYLTLEK